MMKMILVEPREHALTFTSIVTLINVTDSFPRMTKKVWPIAFIKSHRFHLLASVISGVYLWLYVSLNSK